MPDEWPLVLLILGVATTARAFFGFGDALIAMPLLAIVVGLPTAAPLLALTAGAVSVAILMQTWRSVQVQSMGLLVIAAICGVPIGAYFLQDDFERPMKAVLGCVVLGFAAYSLWTPRRITLNTDRWAFLFGFASGVLGGAYNTNGPPIVIYGTMRHWTPEQFRATLQGFFVTSGTAILVVHGARGLWTREVFLLYLAALPVVLTVVFVGGRIAKRFPAERFRRYVYYLLLAIGAFLLYQTFTG